MGIGIENGARMQVIAVTIAIRTSLRVWIRPDVLPGFFVVTFFIISAAIKRQHNSFLLYLLFAAASYT